jgi:hypothetical protein
MFNHRFNYSQILRAIGDDLERRDLKTFEIRKREDRYIVRCGYQSPPAVTPLTLEYGPNEIEELDQRGEESRSDPPQTLDFCKLSQTLRTIGGYLDQKKASLLRVSNNDSPGTEPIFRIEYQTTDGNSFVDDRSTAALYDMGVHLYKQRGKLPRLVANSGGWRR